MFSSLYKLPGRFFKMFVIHKPDSIQFSFITQTYLKHKNLKSQDFNQNKP